MLELLIHPFGLRFRAEPEVRWDRGPRCQGRVIPNLRRYDEVGVGTKTLPNDSMRISGLALDLGQTPLRIR